MNNDERTNVLIVEDERVSRMALRALMAASGYDTEATGSAEEAMQALNSGMRPNIALVDLDLPGMNGLDFIQQLVEVDPNVFPVLITAANGDRLQNVLHQSGVAYLRKPLDFNRLLVLLSEHAMN